MGGGGYFLKFVIVKRGGGKIFICNYFGGVQF